MSIDRKPATQCATSNEQVFSQLPRRITRPGLVRPRNTHKSIGPRSPVPGGVARVECMNSIWNHNYLQSADTARPQCQVLPLCLAYSQTVVCWGGTSLRYGRNSDQHTPSLTSPGAPSSVRGRTISATPESVRH